MKIYLFITLFLSLTFCHSQISFPIDSTISTELVTLGKKKEIFQSIYTNLFDVNFYHRIDSINYDNAIINAMELDSSYYLMEYYFENEKDSFPAIVFINGQIEHDKGFYDSYNKYFLKTDIHKIKKQQKLNYNTRFIRYVNGCGTFIYSIKQRKKDLSRTNQIQLFIQKNGKSIKHSFQTPAKKPKLNIEKRQVFF